jgi:hypothetical protein
MKCHGPKQRDTLLLLLALRLRHGDGIFNGGMSIEGIAFQNPNENQGTAFEKSEAKKRCSGIDGATGMEAAEPDIAGCQWTGNG